MTSTETKTDLLTAIVCSGVGQIETLQVPIEEPGPGEYLIRTEFSAVSPGTELRCLAGMQPHASPFPFVPGYALVGIIEQVGVGTLLPVGTRVLSDGTRRSKVAWMWGGHVSHAISPEASVVKIPEGVPAESAAIAKMASISHRGLHVSRPKPSERVVVIGLGLIGLLSARLFAAQGCKVLALDRLSSRVEMAASEKITARVIHHSAVEMVRDEMPEGPDIVVDATGNVATLQHSMECCPVLPWGASDAVGTRLVIQGSYPDQFCLPYQEAFERELTILLPRDTRPSDKIAVLADIAAGRLNVSDLTTNRFRPEEAPGVYQRLKAGEMLTALFDWREL